MHDLDVWLFKLINLRLANPVLDQIMLTASALGTGSAQAAICFLILFYGWLRDRANIRIAAYTGLAACIGSVFVVQILKHLWQRPRPLAILFEARAVGKALFWNSFPSGHTANALAVAVVLGTFLPKLRFFLFPLAVLISISRIYVGAHYPSDVIGGAALGVIIGLACVGLRNVRTFRQKQQGFTLCAYAYAVLASVCLILFCWRLGAVPLIGLDEGLYAECAREMLVRSNWIVPTVNNQPFFDKPPLAYWLMAASIKVFGVNSFAARLPSCLAALGLVSLTHMLGAKMFGRKTGWMSAMILATSLITVGLARLAILDMLFALTIAAALSVFILTRVGKLPKTAYLISWASAGLAALVKGPVGPILIALVILIYEVLTRHRGRVSSDAAIKLPLVLVGVLIFAAVAVPWYAVVQFETNGAFLREFIIHQNLQRALGQDFHHNMPIFFYVPVYLIGFFPWSVFLPLAWVRFVRRKPQDALSEVPLFAAVWLLTVVGFYSLLRSKLPAYIYPSFPAAALLVGRLWTECLESDRNDAILASLQRYALVAVMLAFLTGGLLIGGLRLLPKPIPRLETALVPMVVSLVAGTTACFLALLKRQVKQAIAGLVFGVTVFLLAAIVLGLPIAAATIGEPAVRLAHQIRSNVLRKEPVFSYRLPSSFASLPFYSQRVITPVKTVRDLTNLSEGMQRFVVVTEARNAKLLPQSRTAISRWGQYVLYRFERVSLR